jgi:TRAP-type C4-dicarboxylate transport system permease small subunit
MLRLLNRVAWLFAMLGGLMASVVALMTVVSVTSRWLTSRPIPGDVELTAFGIAVCISLCLPWCQLHGANIIVDFFTRNARRRTQAWLDGVGAVLLAVMVALLAWRTAMGAVAVHAAGEETMILGVPLWWMYLLLAPGLALAAVVALIQAALHFSGRDVKALQA